MSTFNLGSSSAGNRTNLLTNPVKFYVYRNAALNSSGSPAVVLYDTKVFDTGTNVDVVTNQGRFTAPIAGFYQFSAAAGNTAATATAMQTILYKNGSAALYGQIINPPNAGTNLVVSGILKLAASDYIDVRFVGGSGSVMYTGITICYFQGFLVSTT